MWECALVRPGFSFGSTRCERQVQRDCSSWVRARRKIGAGSWLPLRCKERAPFSTPPPPHPQEETPGLVESFPPTAALSAA